MTSQTRRLLNADFSDVQAEAIDDSITDATRHLATKADLFAVRADLYRAMWLMGLSSIAINAAMLSAAVAVIQLT